MIEISALPGSVTKVMHLHYNDWPLLVTFCCNVNKLFCLFFVQSSLFGLQLFVISFNSVNFLGRQLK